MYMQVSVAKQMRQEVLDRAALHRNAALVQSLNRARRREARAERRMHQARMDARRLRQRLEASS